MVTERAHQDNALAAQNLPAQFTLPAASEGRLKGRGHARNTRLHR